jgi:hypothetical protein
MKNIALALSLLLFTGVAVSNVYAANETTVVVKKKDDDKKKKKKKKSSCCDSKEGKIFLFFKICIFCSKN